MAAALEAGIAAARGEARGPAADSGGGDGGIAGALAAVEAATAVLEDCEFTNAGTGSNLTEDGEAGGVRIR